MADTKNKSEFKTDAFLGALEINEEMNGKDTVKQDKDTPQQDGEKDTFPTDAFREALKINEEMNKK